MIPNNVIFIYLLFSQLAPENSLVGSHSIDPNIKALEQRLTS